MTSTRGDLPTGEVTFLFTDIEGSTALLQRWGTVAEAAFDVHAAIVRRSLAAHRGIEVNTEGDAFFCVFTDPVDAVAAAVEVQRALHTHRWEDDEEVRVRIGIHTGVGTLGGQDYFGLDVHRASRISDAGHGGQIVLSGATMRLVEDALPDGVEPRDLGLFRLRDLTEPEHLFDLVIEGLPSEFPRLRAGTPAATGMPTRLSSFVGREEQIAAVARLLGEHRIVTLTGPGGVGKSRLSMEAADRVAADFHASFFVRLAPLRDAELVAPTILSALGAVPTAEPADTRLPAFLADKRWLLVLDNFEQVIEAAPVIESIAEEASAVRMLVTSRTPLRVRGEREFTVPTLAHAGAGGRSDAFRLFVKRAKEVRPELEIDAESADAIAEIVEALDGLPLAIELAAARVRVMSPAALRARMGNLLDLLTSRFRDMDERQRTIRNTIAWSVELLASDQRRLMWDLSVFRGGATLDTIEAVCELDRGDASWMDDLEALVSHSLVQRVEVDGEQRYTMLELVREYAAEGLRESGQAEAVAARHLEWFLGLAERAAARLTTAEQGTWLAALDRERDNLRGALAFAIERGDAERASRLVLALWRFWQMRGLIGEGISRVEKVLALEQLDVHARLRALEARGGLAWWSGDIDVAASAYEDALALARAQGSGPELARALYNAGLAVGFTGDKGRSEELLSEGIDLGTRLGDVLTVARCRWALGSVYGALGDVERAHAGLATALEEFRSTDEVFMVNWALRELGVMEIEMGEFDEAESHLLPALEFFASMGDLSGTLLLLRDAASLAAHRADRSLALRLMGAVAAAEAETGIVVAQFELDGADRRAVSDRDAERHLVEEGRAWSLETAVDAALGRAHV